MPIFGFSFPFIKFGQRIKGLRLGAFGHLDDGCDEFFNKWKFQQTGPIVVNEIYQEPLDVGAVLILIGHDHHFAITQAFQIFNGLIFFLVGEAQNFHQLGDLFVFHDLFMCSISNIEQFTPKWINSIVISSNDSETCHGKSFGGISFS